MQCRRKSGYGSYGPSRRQKGARVIVLKRGEPADRSETYLRLADGSAFEQQAAWRPPWMRMQWACEAGAQHTLMHAKLPAGPTST